MNTALAGGVENSQASAFFVWIYFQEQGVVILGFYQKEICLQIGGRTMIVTKMEEGYVTPISRKVYSQEELQKEYEYTLAQNITKKMLDQGLISIDEFNKITELNRKSFSPLLAGIMGSNR